MSFDGWGDDDSTPAAAPASNGFGDDFGSGGFGGGGDDGDGERRERKEVVPSKTLFIKGLNEDTTQETVLAAFDGATSARIQTDRETGLSKGIAYVDFPSEPDATVHFNNAKETKGMDIDGANVFVGYAKERAPREGGAGGEIDPDKPPPSTYCPPPPPEDDDMYTACTKGIHFDKYESIPVEVTGENPPRHVSTFEACDLPETVLSNVKRAGYERPTPVQKYGIPIINADRDMMACAQTGSGKTAAFVLPVLASLIRGGLESSSFSDEQYPQAIVIGPTRELVYQIYLEARKFSRSTICRPVVAYGGTSVGHQLRDLQKGCHILVATPGRLMDFIKRGKIKLDKLQYLILDEADRMLDMGFESEIRTLVSSPGIPAKEARHTLMFSATFPDEIQKLAHDFLKEDFLFLTVGRVGGACSDVEQVIMQVDQSDKRDELLKLVEHVRTSRQRTLVFVETKRNADFLACYLSQDADFACTSIHGDRLQQQREEALRDFKSGECPLMVATSVAARGLDIPDVQHVINYDLPSDIDEYVHRIGRTGRCGNLGKATSFYDDSKDSQLSSLLVKTLADANQVVPDWLQESASGAVQSNFGGGGGRGGFGSRDARQGKGRGGGGGSRSTGDFDYNDGGGFNNGGAAAGGDDDDDWD